MLVSNRLGRNIVQGMLPLRRGRERGEKGQDRVEWVRRMEGAAAGDIYSTPCVYSAMTLT